MPFKHYPIGYIHVDITELLTGMGKQYLFVAIDRATQYLYKEATTKKYHYADFETLKQHLMIFLLHYNYQRPLKSLKLKTPWEMVQKWHDEKPDLFKQDISRKITGLNY